MEAWRPHLDTAMNEVRAGERNLWSSVILQQRSFREVGDALDSEDAAKKRVGPALKNTHRLGRRTLDLAGITSQQF